MGKLIVIEGTDGSGKGTQLQLLLNYLNKKQISYASFDFPQYGKTFFVKILARKIINQIGVDILKLYKVKIIVSEKTLEAVSQKGYDPRFGARNLERTIRDEIEDKVAKLIFEDKVKAGDIINL